MTDPEASDTAKSMADGSGDPDLHSDSEKSGQDVGGPASASESTLEESLSQGTSVDKNESPDSQSRNPL
jgi:hypothetical protein